MCSNWSCFSRLCIILQIAHGTLGQMALSAMNYLYNIYSKFNYINHRIYVNKWTTNIMHTYIKTVIFNLVYMTRFGNQISLIRPLVIEVTSQKSEWSCICVLRVSIFTLLLRLFIVLLKCESVPKVWYFIVFNFFHGLSMLKDWKAK